MESHHNTSTTTTTADVVDMGMGGSNNSNGTPSTAAACSRWNPTKEQIRMLENLYKQGIRTPSEEQIQEITTRLKAFGHIEGKNVFYWFQNHKARQRQKQKQKQESHVAYFNRYINASQPLFSSPLCQNVVCLPQNEISFYSQHPKAKVLVPGFISPRSEKVMPIRMPGIMWDGQHQQIIYEQFQQRIIHIPGYYDQFSNNNNNNNSNHETLTLFPLHPTGILDNKTNNDQLQVSSVASIFGDSSTTDTSYCSPHIDEDIGRHGNQPFFNFLSSGQGSRESDN